MALVVANDFGRAVTASVISNVVLSGAICEPPFPVIGQMGRGIRRADLVLQCCLIRRMLVSPQVARVAYFVGRSTIRRTIPGVEVRRFEYRELAWVWVCEMMV